MGGVADVIGREEELGRLESFLAEADGRAPGRGELTPSERCVAELVARGLTNREVAAALFLADRTVEGP